MTGKNTHSLRGLRCYTPQVHTGTPWDLSHGKVDEHGQQLCGTGRRILNHTQHSVSHWEGLSLDAVFTQITIFSPRSQNDIIKAVQELHKERQKKT